MEVVDAALATAGKPCVLGSDPARYLERFEDWLEHHDLLASSIGVKEEAQKLKLLLLWGGKDFRKFAKDAEVIIEGQGADSFKTAVDKIRAKCGSQVNLSMAMFKLMHVKQGTKPFTDFIKEVDELATQCQFDTKPYNRDRAMKDSIIFGTSDEKLRQEALAKDFSLADIQRADLGYEQSRRLTGAIKRESHSTRDDCRRLYTQDEVDNLVARVTTGKYSSKFSNSEKSGKPEYTTQKCRNCPPHYRPHDPSKCPARGKTCVVCKGKNHFARSASCKGEPVRTVDDGTPEELYCFGETVGHIEEVCGIGQPSNNHKELLVTVKINDHETNLIVDSGCKRTLIPRHRYTTDMGPIQKSSIKFRPYGTTTYLNCLGGIPSILTSISGAEHHSTVYVVEGHQVEPLLGEVDAKALGILSINKEGGVVKEEAVAGISSKLQDAGISVRTELEPDEQIGADAKKRIDSLLDKHQSVFEGIGLLKGEEVKFHIDYSVPPVTAQYRPVPLAYRDRLSGHLQELREAGKIEDVNPKEHCPWVSNVVITEKKQANQIRMNIDMREANKALNRTKRHVPTITEIRHKLKGATRFSEMDMGHGYHQIGLEKESRSISTFQTHEGLHRFKVLFFGASPATDLFHERVSAALDGLNGCTSIHDNILVWGSTDEEHEANLDACLTRLQEKGLTLRRQKCTFGKTSVSWFGWIFSKSGMSIDPVKVKAIREAGRPESTEDVKSFLQACQFNAKFMCNSDQAYAQLTGPLRALTHKNVKFAWTDDCERAYLQIIETMTSTTALRPFDPKLKTVHVADGSPKGIAASIYQVQSDGTWVAIDHASRALTQCEQNYSQIERESLAQTWGIQYHRYYLLGIDFDTYTDHEPLLPIYMGKKTGNARVERHRIKIQGFQYTMKHIPGKQIPCDYWSRHPLSLASYTEKELTDMFIDQDDELCISRIVTDDLPDAVTLEMVQRATRQDPVMQKLIKSINKGYITQDKDLKPYRHILQELTHTEGVILRGDRLLIPDTELAPGLGSLRKQIVETAHEGHQGASKTKRLIRAKMWFPNLDDMVNTHIEHCLGCQAATYVPTRDPLKPTTLPDRPWQKIDADFWGPLPSGGYLLVMIDEYSRYPEVELVKGTSAQAVVPHIDKIFTTHGFPESVKTDGGPPFNGNDSHTYQQYMKWAGVKPKVVSPDDPEANGLAENFMKVIRKVWHIAQIEKKNPFQEMNKFLRHYRATPHSTTNRPPAEVLFNRTYHTRLPEVIKPAQDPQLRLHDAANKEKQKRYKDAKSNVRPHNIRVGDEVLILQPVTKTQSRYDPDPYRVTRVRGSQITANRGNKVRTRDAKKFKKVTTVPPANYREQRNPLILHPASSDFGFDFGAPGVHNQAARNHQALVATGTAAEPPTRNGNVRNPAAQNRQDQAEPVVKPKATPRKYNYPNSHLDPNIDVNMTRGSRNRRQPQRFDAASGQ
jgi:hypothetical protein